MSMEEAPEAVAAAPAAFEMAVDRDERRHEYGQAEKFEVAVAEDLFGEEVQRREHGDRFAAGAADPASGPEPSEFDWCRAGRARAGGSRVAAGPELLSPASVARLAVLLRIGLRRGHGAGLGLGLRRARVPMRGRDAHVRRQAL